MSQLCVCFASYCIRSHPQAALDAATRTISLALGGRLNRPFGGVGMVSFMAKHIRSHREESAIRAADDEAISLILHRSTVSLC